MMITVPPPDGYVEARALREQLAEIFFQYFRVPSLFIINQVRGAAG